MKWTLAVIAGGGAAGLVQTATVAARTASTAATGGLANPLVSTMELAGSVTTSVTAIFAPILVILVIAIFGLLLGRKLFRKGGKVQPVEGAIGS
jgi:hypothetical protein